MKQTKTAKIQAMTVSILLIMSITSFTFFTAQLPESSKPLVKFYGSEVLEGVTGSTVGMEGRPG